MKTLLILDEKNYEDCVGVFEKFAVRGIVRKNGKIAVQQAGNGEYKILGGGVEKCETYEDALCREVREEGGLLVIPATIEEIGEIIEIRRDLHDDRQKYICHSLFYYCDIKDQTVELEMTESEIQQGFHLEWISPREFVEANKKIVDKPWIDRDVRFIQMMIDKEV